MTVFVLKDIFLGADIAERCNNVATGSEEVPSETSTLPVALVSALRETATGKTPTAFAARNIAALVVAETLVLAEAFVSLSPETILVAVTERLAAFRDTSERTVSVVADAVRGADSTVSNVALAARPLCTSSGEEILVRKFIWTKEIGETVSGAASLILYLLSAVMIPVTPRLDDIATLNFAFAVGCAEAEICALPT
jgi:hypothetical protein